MVMVSLYAQCPEGQGEVVGIPREILHPVIPTGLKMSEPFMLKRDRN
jgi:hypothetical protein